MMRVLYALQCIIKPINTDDLMKLIERSAKNLAETGSVDANVERNSKKATDSKRGGADSGNPLSVGLQDGGRKHLSHNDLTPQLDYANIVQQTKNAKKIQNLKKTMVLF